MTTQPTLFDAAESRLRRDLGIRSAASRHGVWLSEARQVAEYLAYHFNTVTADDVRAAGITTPEDASPNVWGALFNDPRFEFVGYTHSARPVAHRNLIRVWRLAQTPLPSSSEMGTSTDRLEALTEDPSVQGRGASR